MPTSGLTTYPDLTVVCRPWQRDPEDSNTVTNPRLVVEVLSDSTASYDRGEKLAQYQSIPSVDEIVLVAHDARRLELWRRGSDGRWQPIVAESGGRLKLESAQATLEIDALYRDLVSP